MKRRFRNKTPLERSDLVRLLRRSLEVVGRDRPRLQLAAVLALIAGLLEAALLYVVASMAVATTRTDQAVEASFGPLPDLPASVGSAALVAGGVLMLLVLVSHPLARVMGSLSARATARMRIRLVRAYLNATLAYRSTLREGYLEQLTGEYVVRAELAMAQLVLVIVSVCSLSVLTAAAVVTNPIGVAGAFTGFMLLAALLRPLARRASRHGKEHTELTRDVVGRSTEALRVAEEISVFDVGQSVGKRLSPDIERAAGWLGKIRYDGRWIPGLFQFGALGCVVLLIGLLSVAQDDALTGIAPLILLLVRALTYIRQLVSASQMAREVTPFAETLLDETERLEANSQPRGGRALERFTGLELSDVGYAYESGQSVLAGVDLTISPGETIGIIGPSGSGKSTLTQLILRLRLPTYGAITTGDYGLSEIAPEAWAKICGFVPQESRVIHGTVSENIKFFREGFDLEHVEAAARAAHIHSEILALPEGYDTLTGPGARGLSGGQRQRLAIARALLGHPQLLVLDEPTSALDEHSERQIAGTLADLRGRVTLIVVAHRPATLRMCDKIYRVAHGTLIEQPAATAHLS